MEAAGIEWASDVDANVNTTFGCENCQEPCASRALHLCGTSGQSLSLLDSTEPLEAQIDEIAYDCPHLPQHEMGTESKTRFKIPPK